MAAKKIWSLIFGIAIISVQLSGQVFAPAASDSFSAVYNPQGGTDKVFVFNKAVYKAASVASITAVSNDRTTGWSFQWSVYNPSSQLYVNLPGTGSGWFSAIDTITVNSGYRVVITKGTSTYIFRVWILMNDFNLTITNKDGKDKLKFGYFNCSSLDLRADTTLVPLFYYNPDTKAKITVYKNFIIRWKTDNDEASTPSSRLITRVNNPPAKDTWYIITLTDNFSLQRKDSVFYESIQSDAKMTGAYVNLSDTGEYSGYNYGAFYEDGIKSAPGKYRFDVSASKNLAGYELNFGDGENLVSGTDTLVRVHEFKKPGIYRVKLTTKSAVPYECIDSVSTQAELVYATAENFAFPNVFSPNSDGENDIFAPQSNNVFRSSDVSVTLIDITIFDKQGRKVHAYSGSMRDWEGWDGRIMSSNREAPEGVYFYAITFLGAWEDKNNPVRDKVFKGFFHLYRE